MLTPGGSILSLIAGSAALIVGLARATQQSTDLAVQETVAGAVAGLAIGAVYWTAHYAFSVRVRVGAAYYEIVR
jgi:NO-binding membrane sensor protein with MHYT domain